MIDIGGVVSNFIDGIKFWFQNHAFDLFMKFLPYILIICFCILAYSVWYMIQKYE